MTSVHDDRETPSTHRWARPVLAVYWIALFITTHWPRLQIQIEGMEEVPIDKFLHFGTFFLLSMLIFYAAPAGPAARFATNLLVASVIATAYAFFDEYSQTLVERVFDRVDISANLIAVSCVSLIVAWSSRERHRPAREDGTSDSKHAFIGHALTIGSLTFASRILGLVRDSVMVATFGVAGVSDAFFLAFKIPNLFRRLFGEGALSAAFIPVYTELLRDDPPASRRFAALTVALLMVVLGVLTLLGEGVLFGLENAFGWSSESALAIRLTMVMLPYMPMVCLVAVLGAMLQVHGRFGPAALAPIVLNLCLIAAAVVALLMSDSPLEQRIHLVALAVLIAGLCQLALLVVTALICVVSGISILVSIYNSMSDRKHEIAVMRALGASRSTVMTVILLESILLSLAGGIAGWTGGHTLNTVAGGEIEARTGVSVGFFSVAPPLENLDLWGLGPIIGLMSPELWLIPALILLAIIVGFLPALAAYQTDVAKSLGS